MRLLPLVLWLFACGSPASPEAPDHWRVVTAPSFAAAEHEIVERDGAYVATFPAMGMHAEFDSVGLSLGDSGLGLAAWGRHDDALPVAAVAPALGQSLPGLVDPAGRPIPRLEYDHAGVTEWWAGQPDGLEHGWTIDAPPPGTGPLSFELRLDNLDVIDVQADAVQLIDGDGRLYDYQGLAAFDATGRPLPSHFQLGPEGLRVLVDDRDAAYPVEVDPVLSTASATLTGASTSSQFGYALSSAGDVDNDGYDDLIVGSPYASSLAGRAYVFHGSASGLSTTATSTLSVSSAYLCGRFVAGGGDANGDGYDDVALSCTYNGYVRVFHGSASGVSTTSTTSLSGNVTSRYGQALALDGDVHNDGYDDLVVGSPGHSSAKGRIYVYRGSSTGISSSSSTFDGPDSGAYFGQALAYAGDVDNDGYDDVIIGAPYYSDSESYQGRVEVHHGSSSGVSSTATTEIDGAAAADIFGYAVDGGGDVNGDGYDDVIIGQYAASAEAWVHHGSASGVSATAATTLTESDTSFGTSVSIVGDTDNDGYDDVACGAINAQTAYVYAGSAAGVGTTAVNSFSSSSGNDYGNALAGADVNGDGHADLAVADYADSSGYGKVYVYLGYADADADGYIVGGEGDEDCDDGNASVNPAASETVGDGVDANCDGAETCYDDDDDDGYLDTTGDTVLSADTDCADLGEGSTSTLTSDCDDSDASVSPAATESTGDEVDQDCDGAETCYDDDDDDGYLDTTGDTVLSADTDCADLGEGSDTSPTTDCDETNGSIYPGATDTPADGIDADCNGMESCYADQDGDGYRTTSTVSSIDSDCTDAGEALSTDPSGDCDDGDAAVSPAASETTGDEVDQDCDGTEVCYADADGDGYRSASTVASADEECDDAGEAPSTATVDCDDTDASVNPGASETTGDEVDQDCDDEESCYADADADGYAGDDTVASLDLDCDDAGENGATDPDGDCDDGDASVNPGAAEVVGDGLDSDCDGAESCYADNDGDGSGGSTTVATSDADCTDAGEDSASDDCDDTNASVNPSAAETAGDEVDQNCDGAERCYVDADGDGFGGTATAASADTDCDDAGESTLSTDCATGNASAYPGATETPGDGVDSDCDGSEACYADNDDDGYRTGESVASADADCTDAGEALTSEPAGDCDDDDGTVNPAATEGTGDEVDQDCDGTESCYADVDDDGYRTADTASSADDDCTDSGEASDSQPSDDCDDGDATVNPGAAETTGDAIDADCDGTETCFLDEDDDGYLDDEPGTIESSDLDCDDANEGSTGDDDGDCDDTDPAYNPAATETDCTDANDYNCDGSVGYDDADGDGYAACEECDDGNATVNPAAAETAGDGVDQDCDGEETCYVDVDDDGYRPDTSTSVHSTDTDCLDSGEGERGDPSDDCDDNDASVYPAATEVVGDEIDQDCDGGESCYADADLDEYRSDSDTVESTDEDCDDVAEAAASDPAADCDDNSSAYNPGAEDVCDDPNDYNCDGYVGSDDNDGDGYVACDDCDDGSSAANPGAEEVCDEADNDCDGYSDENPVDGHSIYIDGDDDGYGDPSTGFVTCEDIEGFVDNGDDCDDTVDTVNPAATEVPGDGIDNDCDGFDGDPPDTGDTGDSGDSGDSGDTDSGVDPDPTDSGDVDRVGGLYGGLSCNAGPGAGLAAVVSALALWRRRTPRGREGC